MPSLAWHAARVAARIESVAPRRLRFWLRFVVVAALLVLISKGHFAGSGDPVHYMTIARSIAFDGDLDVANDYADPDTLIQNGALEMGAHGRPGRGGVIRPVHDVGLSLVATPYFAVSYAVAKRLTPLLPERLRRQAKLDEWIMLRQLMSLGMIMITAVLAGVFFDVCLDLTGHRTISWLWALCFTLSPPILSHAYVFFPEIPAALLALLLFRSRESVRQRAAWRVLLLGLGAGFMWFLHVRYAPLGLALFCVLAARLRAGERHLGMLSLGFAAAVVGRTALNLFLWGSWLTTPHAGFGHWLGVAEQALEALRRAAGLCFDQEHGLLLSAPIYLLAPAGLRIMRRRASRATLEIVAIASVYVLPILLPLLNTHGWRGGWSPAARFLTPIMPLLALPVLYVFVQRRARVLVLGLLALQASLDVLLWSQPMLQWSEGTGMAPFILAVGGERLAAALPSLARLGGLDAAIMTGMAALWILISWLLGRERSEAALNNS